MMFSKKFVILTFVTLTLYNTVDCASERECSYFCNIQGSRYGNTVSKNNGKTLLEHAKSLGSQYNYYMPCCDGELRSRENITIVSKDLKTLPNSTVKMRGSFTYMPTDRYCSTYCALDLDKRITYFMNSEGMTFEKFVNKYSADQYKNKYHLFTYCCDGTFTTDRMTYTRDKTQFSLHIPTFKINQDSLTKVKSQLQNELLNQTCSYYCNVKNKKIISISHSNGKNIKEYAEVKKDYDYDSYIKCCNGKVDRKQNVAVYTKKKEVALYQNIDSPYIFDYFAKFNSVCNNYCGFNTSKKTYSIVKSQGKSLTESLKSYRNVFDYMTFCCDGKKEIKGILVSARSNGEQCAINTKEYSYKAVNQDSVENSLLPESVENSLLPSSTSEFVTPQAQVAQEIEESTIVPELTEKDIKYMRYTEDIQYEQGIRAI